MFKLKKIDIEPYKTSKVGVGESFIGTLKLFMEDQVTDENPTLKSIQKGKRVYISNLGKWVITSRILGIIKRTEDKVTFKTTTSTYEITKED